MRRLPLAVSCILVVLGGTLPVEGRPGGFTGVPPNDQAWLWIDYGADGVLETMQRARQVFQARGYALFEYDLGLIEHVRLLYDVKAFRGIPWSAPVELYVGDRYFLGSKAVLEFLTAWESGTVDVLSPQADPDPSAANGDPTETTKGGGASPPEDTDSTPGDPVAPVQETADSTATVLTATTPPAASPSTLGLLLRYPFTLLAIVAAVSFILLSLRSTHRAKEHSDH